MKNVGRNVVFSQDYLINVKNSLKNRIAYHVYLFTYDYVGNTAVFSVDIYIIPIFWVHRTNAAAKRIYGKDISTKMLLFFVNHFLKSIAIYIYILNIIHAHLNLPLVSTYIFSLTNTRSRVFLNLFVFNKQAVLS